MKLKDLPSPKRPTHLGAVIVGSGPSNREVDFSWLDTDRVLTIAINREITRNRECYTPDAWIFNDSPIADAFAATPIAESIITVVRNVPRTIIKKKVRLDAVFEGTKVWDDVDIAEGKFFIHNTTATTAVMLAVHWGFDEILMLGVDCRGNYYTEEPDHEPTAQELLKRSQMKPDMETLHEWLGEHYPEVAVCNGSLLSKVSGFQKVHFLDWIAQLCL